MGLGLEGLSDSVGEYLGNIAAPAAEFAVEDIGKGLRDGAPFPGLIGPVIAVEVGRRACKRYADNASAFDAASSAQFENLCRPYLDDIGYGTPPSIKVPFRGGQCYTSYNYTYTFRDPNTGELQDSNQTVSGRILGLVEVFNSNGFTKSGGIRRQQTPGGAIDNILLGSTFNTLPLDQSISNIQRVDGLPDNCGSPAPVVTDPKPPATPLPPGPSPFNPAPGIDIDIDVDIDIDPITGPRIVFDIGDGPVTIDPFPDGGGGDDGGDDGGAPVSGLPPGDIGSPGTPEPTDETGKASGCAPPNSVLVGVKVNIVATPQFASEYDPLVKRGACYVYMGTSSNLALEPAGVALRSGQMFFAPLDNLTCWEVNANTGYVLQVIPYYRALEPQEV